MLPDPQGSSVVIIIIYYYYYFFSHVQSLLVFALSLISKMQLRGFHIDSASGGTSAFLGSEKSTVALAVCLG